AAGVHGLAARAIRRHDDRRRAGVPLRLRRPRAEPRGRERDPRRRAQAGGRGTGGDPGTLPDRRGDEGFRMRSAEPISAAPAAPIVAAAMGTLCTAGVVRGERAGRSDTYAAGTLCPDETGGPDGPCNDDSLFDLASLTKLATTALVLAFVRERLLELDMPFRELVPDFRGGAKDRVTLRHVLTHTGGLTWWKPLWKEASSLAEAVWLAAKEPAGRARTDQVAGDNIRRGLGLALRAPNGPMCGRYFSLDAYGHTGFTGTSLWIDPAIDLTVIILTNRVYFGRQNDDALYQFRIAVHEALSAP